MSQILDAYIDGISSLKDKTVKIVLRTQEMKGSDLANLFSMNGDLVKCLLSDENITKEVQTEVDNLVIESGNVKTPSERLRGVLYRLWEHNPDGFDTFTLFYQDRMERIITQIKEKL